MAHHFHQGLAWFQAVFMDRAAKSLQASPTRSDDAWYLDQDDRRIEPNDGHWNLADGEAVGTVTGGNLCTFNLLHGTPWMPELRGATLFVEDDLESSAHTFARDLVSLRHQPGFDEIGALVIGRFQRASEIDRTTLADVVASLDLDPGVPVIGNVDIGHTDPMAVLPIGGSAHVAARGAETAIEVSW